MLICGEIASTLGESLAVFRALATFVRALIPCVDTECHRVPQPSAAVPGYAHRRTRTGSCVPEAQGSLPQGPTHGTHASLGRTVRTAYRVLHHRLSQHRPELRVALQLPMLSDEAGGGEGQGWPLLLLYPG